MSPLPTVFPIEIALGSILVRYERDSNNGAVGLLLLPVSKRSHEIPRRQHIAGVEVDAYSEANKMRIAAVSVDSLVQIKTVGDDYAPAFSQGRTLRNSGTVAALNFVGQRVQRSKQRIRIRTTLRHHSGWLVHHDLAWTRGTSWLESSTTVTNTTRAGIILELLSSFSISGITPFAPDDAAHRMRIHRFRSVWSMEGRLETRALEDFQLERSWVGWGVRSERFGVTGSMPCNGFFPCAAVEDSEAKVVWGAQLAHNASWQMEFYRRDDALAFSGGLADREFGHWTKRLAPQESLTTPKAFLVCVEGTIEDCCSALVAAQEPALKGIPKIEHSLPVIFNEWATTWGKPTHVNMVALAQSLQGLGITYLVMDAGWYAQRDGAWNKAHGDWQPSRDFYPNGLRATADAIRQAGFIPGIWFEMETCGRDSKAFTRKQLLIHRDGRPLTIGDRRFLDLRKRGACAHWEKSVLGLLREAGFLLEPEDVGVVAQISGACVVDLAEAWSDTGNSYYTSALTSQLRQFIAEMPPPALDLTRCSGYVSGLPRDGWRTIEAGLRCGYFWPDAFVRVVRSSSVSDGDLVEWVKSFVEHARYLEEFHQTASNYAGFESLGIYSVGMLFPEMNEAATWRMLGMQRMSDEIDGLSVYPDGTQMELSPWYHAGMLRYALRMAQLADDQGHPLPATFLPALERMYGYLLHLSTSDSWKVPNLNDSEPMEARSWIESATRLSDGTSLFPDRADFAWISSNRLNGSAPDEISHFFNFSGQAVMRSDWGETSNALLFVGGPFGLNGGHSHENKLSIYMTAFGQELLPASGRYLYTFSNPFRIYCLSTRAHSTVMVDGKEQFRRGSMATYTVSAPLTTMDWKSGALFDYSSAAYGEDSANEKFYSVSPTPVNGTFGVSNPMDAAHRRHVLFVKPSYWIVVDDLKPVDSASHTWISQFHLADFPYSIDSGTNRVTLQQTGRPALTLTPLNENGLTASVTRGAGSESDPANILGWTTTSDGVKSPIPVARFSRTTTGRTQIAVVLYPTATGATPASPAITRLASSANLCAVRVVASGQPQMDFVINLDFATSPNFSWGGFSYVNKRYLVVRDGVPINEDAPSVSLETLRTTLNSNLGQTPVWRLTRFGGDVSQPLTVTLQAAGDAVAGTDYQPLPTSVTIPAFVLSATIPITPIAPASPRPNRTVSLATPASSDYTVASTASLGVSLYDSYAGSGEVVFFLEPGGTGQYVLPIQNTTGEAVTYTVGDPANYSYSSSKQQGGPSLDWQDISTTGNLFDATSSYSRTDDAMSQVSLSQFQGQSFTFPFYGSNFGSVRVSTNGFLTFDTSFPDYSSYFNNTLPNTTYPTGFSSFPYPNLVALLWDDLVVPNTLYGKPAPNGTIHTQLVDADTFIVQYTNVKPYSQLGNGDERFTGQVVLKRDGRIFLKYKSFNFGQDTATVGIQNGARNKALQLAYNQPFVVSNLAVEIAPPVPWITTSATSVNAPFAGSGNLTLGASAAGLTAGTEKTYNLAIQPTSGNQSAIVVPVRLHVMTPLETWKANTLGVPEDGNFQSGVWADSADPDHDGLPNLVEFALGSDPLSSSAVSPVQAQVANEKLQITFQRARADLTYIVEGSSDLVSWQSIATNPGTVGSEVTQPDAVTMGPRRFLRLRVTSP